MRYATLYSAREFTPLPGCNQVVVSHGMFMKPEFRGNGLGKSEQKASLDEMKFLGYDYAICTVRADNDAQKKILLDSGWRQLDSFVSSYTMNGVLIFGRVV